MGATEPCNKETGSPSSLRVTEARFEAPNKVPKTKCAYTVEAHESTRQRVESSLPTKHEDYIAGKGFTSMTHYNLVHKFIPFATSDENSGRKSCKWTRHGKSLRQSQHGNWRWRKSRARSILFSKHRETEKKVHFATLIDICHLKNAESKHKLQKYKGRVVLRGDTVKDDSGAYAVFTEQGSSASQVTATKVMDVIARLPDCDGPAADALSAYT